MLSNYLLITNQTEKKGEKEMKRKNNLIWPSIVVLMILIGPLLMVGLSQGQNKPVRYNIVPTEPIAVD